MLTKKPIFLLYPLLLAVWQGYAVELTVELLDVDGKPVNNAVVLLRSPLHPALTVSEDFSAVMDQVNRRFVPHTLVVQQGTRVRFPNSDQVKHHVYSFSPAKTFELKLYSEIEVDPQVFDNPGVVELGCNIHDWMLAYVYVADTPFFAQTNAQGLAVLEAPEGQFSLSVWHPRMEESDQAIAIPVQLIQTRNSVRHRLVAPLLPSLSEYDDDAGLTDYD